MDHQNTAAVGTGPSERPGKAPRSPESSAWQGSGRVRVAGSEHYVIEVTDGTTLRARRAASCLLQPEVGDEVAWLRTDKKDSSWIVAVLVHAADGAQQIVIEGDASLSTRNGSLRISADRSVEVHAPAVSARGDELRLQGTRATVVLDTLDAIGRVCTLTLAQVRLVGDQLSSVFDRTFHRARQQQRIVDGIDSVQTHTADWRAKELMSLHAENVLVDGERLVKTRGAQIHLG